MPFRSPLVVTPHGDDRWELEEALVYEGAHDRWVIPAGYVTDYATTPRIVAGLVPRSGRYTRATIVHDYLITDVWPAGGIDAADLDGVFRRVLRELDVSAPRRWLMWVGVRYGSLFGGRHRGWWRSAPQVIGLSLAFLPIVLPMVAGTAVTLAIWHAVEVAARASGDRNASTSPNLTV